MLYSPLEAAAAHFWMISGGFSKILSSRIRRRGGVSGLLARMVTHVAVRQIVHDEETSIGWRCAGLVGRPDVTQGLGHQGWDLGSGVAAESQPSTWHSRGKRVRETRNKKQGGGGGWGWGVGVKRTARGTWAPWPPRRPATPELRPAWGWRTPRSRTRSRSWPTAGRRRRGSRSSWRWRRRRWRCRSPWRW